MGSLKHFRPGRSRQKLLLIDDDPIQLRIRETILRGAGFEVCIATTGESALAILRSEAYKDMIGTVITDHIMPGLSGADFVRELRKINQNVPVIVLSGMPDAGSDYEGLNVCFRQKPYPPSELIALIRKSMERAA